MKTAFVLALCASLAVGPVMAMQPPAEAPAAGGEVTPAPAVDANGVYQVFRTTDSQLSCAQIIAELNLLNAEIKAQADARAAQQAQAQQAAAQAAAQPARRRGGGFGGLLGAAAQSGLAGAIPGVGGIARNPLAAQAAMAAANAAATGAAQAEAEAAAQQQAQAQAALAAASAQPATDSNEMQRLRRVQGLMQSKGC